MPIYTVDMSSHIYMTSKCMVLNLAHVSISLPSAFLSLFLCPSLSLSLPLSLPHSLPPSLSLSFLLELIIRDDSEDIIPANSTYDINQGYPIEILCVRQTPISGFYASFTFQNNEGINE